MPPTRQYGKKCASIWMTTEPALLVRVPPDKSTSDLEREFAGKNWVNAPVKGDQSRWGADVLPSGLRPNQSCRFPYGTWSCGWAAVAFLSQVMWAIALAG